MAVHKHEHCCEHKNVKYCKVCQVVYCVDCGKEWRDICWTYTYPQTTWTPNWTVTTGDTITCDHTSH